MFSTCNKELHAVGRGRGGALHEHRHQDREGAGRPGEPGLAGARLSERPAQFARETLHEQQSDS